MTTLAPPPRPVTGLQPRRRRRARVLVPLLGVLLGGAVLLTVLTLTDDGEDMSVSSGVVEVDVRPPGKVPTLGVEAQQPTADGATAFALFWFDALNWSLARGDDALLAGHTGGGCAQCNGWLVGISRWKSEQARLEGGLTVPLEMSVGRFSTSEPVPFLATFLTTPATLTRPDGAVEQFAGGRTSGGLAVLWANGRWQMTEVVLDAAAAGTRP